MPNLDALKSQRASIAGELSRVMEARERLRTAEGEESSILAEIGRLGAGEIEALSAWARSGVGAKPQPDAAARAALNERLVAAQLASEQARQAGAGLDADERDLGSRLRDVNARIDDLAWDRLAERHADELDNIAAMVKSHILPKIGRAMGLHAFIVEQGQRHQASGLTDAAVRMFQRAEALPRVVIDLDPAPGEVVGKIETWARRHAALTGDAPLVAEPIDLEVRRREVEASIRPIEPFVPPPAMLPGVRAS